MPVSVSSLDSSKNMQSCSQCSYNHYTKGAWHTLVWISCMVAFSVPGLPGLISPLSSTGEIKTELCIWMSQPIRNNPVNVSWIVFLLNICILHYKTWFPGFCWGRVHVVRWSRSQTSSTWKRSGNETRWTMYHWTTEGGSRHGTN